MYEAAIVKTPKELECFLLLGDAVIVTDINHVVINVNKTFETITGFNKNEVIGQDAGMFKSCLTPRSTFLSMKKNLNKLTYWSGVFINKKKSGELWHSSITITPIECNQTVYYIGVFKELEQLSDGMYLSNVKKEEVQKELLKVLAISCEIRDPGIENHLLRVQELTKQLVEAHIKKNDLTIDLHFLQDIKNSSILHDIGKAGIPEGILYKPGKLTTYERKIIEMHPQMGKDILDKVSTEASNDFMKSRNVAENIILYHHEYWNGEGYPFGLKGEDIPFEARIVAIVDVYDALTSQRAYKAAWTKQRALKYILERKGVQFDPKITDTFIHLFNFFD
ncbi:HD domain-containing phosphohydrolase [Evansella sp. AB-rgal1]|uniref:HD domain-containing phosphohydrolase n=1 Tax=Evansella sp. AB-rgal1 TaxID=3242696 RepID=UPI00359EB3CD